MVYAGIQDAGRECVAGSMVAEKVIYELGNTKKAAALFDGWQETMIWSCLQGVMGKIYVDSLKDPVSAMALLGDFCFLAGKPDRRFVLFCPKQGGSRTVIMVPQDGEWAKLIRECYGEYADEVVRYAVKKEPDVFDQKRLAKIVGRLPEGFDLKQMDEGLFWRCKRMEWCRDWVSQYDDYGLYRKFGIGVVIIKDGEPVSGASSYSGYRGGIEIQIDTREDYRRMGLAAVCGAKLILECLRRGWYPSWDAQNRQSLALAEKLGYHLDREYAAFEVVQEMEGNESH